ncbi:MAG: hypothetical protein R2830_07155 [Saprospiraceae bacterium]
MNQVANKKQISDAKKRFWLGYLLSLLLAGVLMYYSVRLPDIDKKVQNAEIARMKQRDNMWSKMAEAASALNKIYEINQRNEGSIDYSIEDQTKVDKLQLDIEKAFSEINKICINDPTGYQDVEEVLKGAKGYNLLINKGRRDLVSNLSGACEKVKQECEKEKDKLESEKKDLQNKIDNLQMMMMMKAGGGGGGGKASSKESGLDKGGGGEGDLGDMEDPEQTSPKCAALEKDNEKLASKVNKVKGLAYDIINQAGQIEISAGNIKKNDNEKEFIRSRVTEIKGIAEAIRKM